MSDIDEETFWKSFNDYYENRTEKQAKEDAAELAIWDQTLMDGLEDEEYDREY